MKQPPHPIVSSGNQNTDSMGVHVSDALKKRINKLFGVVPHEEQFNRLSVGSGDKISTSSNGFDDSSFVSIYWQPHNIRLYFDFERVGFTPEKPAEPTPKNLGGVGSYFKRTYLFTSKNHGSEFFYDKFCGCSITVKKTTVLVRYHLHAKQWRHLRGVSPEEIDSKIDGVIQSIVDHCRDALGVFIQLHGGRSSLSLVREFQAEHKIRGDEFIDSIPAEMIIHDPDFKKVYKERNVEFYGVGSVRNFIHNRVVDLVAPSIAKELNGIRAVLVDPLEIARRNGKLADFLFANNSWFNSLSSVEKSSVLSGSVEGVQ